MPDRRAESGPSPGRKPVCQKEKYEQRRAAVAQCPALCSDSAAYSDSYEQNGPLYHCFWIYHKKGTDHGVYDLDGTCVYAGHPSPVEGVFYGTDLCHSGGCFILLALCPSG